MLYRLQQEVAELEERMLVLYLGDIIGETPADFYRSLLLGIAKILADDGWDDRARDISNTIRGFTVQQAKITTEGQVKLGLVSFGAKTESPNAELIPTSNFNPYPLLRELLDEAELFYGRIVIAIDDLDKKDVTVVKEILEGSLNLFRSSEKRAFIMTGKGFTDLQDVTLQALGIFAEDIKLEPMSPEALRQITINYLNTARQNLQDTTYSFIDEVMNLITDYAQGNPRQLNSICEKVLRQAALEEREIIDLLVFSSVWNQIQTQVTYSVSPHLRRLLYVAYQAGGISEDIADEYLDQLGVSPFLELIPLLQTLEQQELLVRQEKDSGLRFVPSKLFQPQLPPKQAE